MSRLFLYSTEYADPLPAEVLHSLLELLPYDLQQKALKYQQWQDVHASVLGKLLLRMALEALGYPSDLGRLQYTEWKKPFLPEGPPFNISHSGNRVVCVLSTKRRVGVDIEARMPVNFEQYRSQFSAGEWAAIESASSPLDSFYELWTARESLAKGDGRGLGLSMPEVNLHQGHNIAIDDQQWCYRSLPLYAGYACHLAIKGAGMPPLRFHEPTPADILHASRDW